MTLPYASSTLSCIISDRVGCGKMVCMNSAMSTEDGAGLGTLGFTEGLAREMTQQAGFVDFEKLDVDNPLNSYYVLRK